MDLFLALITVFAYIVSLIAIGMVVILLALAVFETRDNIKIAKDSLYEISESLDVLASHLEHSCDKCKAITEEEADG